MFGVCAAEPLSPSSRVGEDGGGHVRLGSMQCCNPSLCVTTRTPTVCAMMPGALYGLLALSDVPCTVLTDTVSVTVSYDLLNGSGVRQWIHMTSTVLACLRHAFHLLQSVQLHLL